MSYRSVLELPIFWCAAHSLLAYFFFWTGGYTLAECLFGAICCSIAFLVGQVGGWRIGWWLGQAWWEYGEPIWSIARGMIKELQELHRAPQELEHRLKASSVQFKTNAPSSSQRTRSRLVVRYEPLQGSREIRLIKLLPSKQQPEELRCELIAASLDNPPAYDAISYCWGDDKDTVRIVCDDQLIDISANLFDALSRMRGTGSTIVWADQICINQQDVAERNSQVQFMRDIYTNASTVFAWIGEDTDDGQAEAGIEMAKVVSRAVENTGILTSGAQLLTMGVDQCARYGIPTFSEGVVGYLSMMNLVGRPYFRRSWIVQEVSLAVRRTTVHCGMASIPFGELAKAIFCGLTIGIPSIAGNSETEAFASLVRASVSTSNKDGWMRPSRHLRDLLVQHRCCLATDPKDKIFAFLGLADDVEQGHRQGIRLVPDYSANKVDVYLDVAAKMLRHYPDLDVLSTRRSGTRSALPSWVPDWEASDAAKISFCSTGLYGERFGNYSATKGSRSACQFKTAHDSGGEAEQLLGLPGYELDVIEEVQALGDDAEKSLWGQNRGDAAMTRDFLSEATRVCRARIKGRVYRHTGEAALDAFCATLTAAGEEYLNAMNDLLNPAARGQEKESFTSQCLHYALSLKIRVIVERLPKYIRNNFWLRFLICSLASKPYEAAAFWRGEWIAIEATQTFIQRMIMSTNGRRFFRTKNGFIGLGPRGCEPGDSVGLFKGGRVPLVFRAMTGETVNNSGGQDYHELLGDAYLHGVMKGEEWREDGCAVMWFR